MYKEKEYEEQDIQDKVLRVNTLLKATEVADILKASRAMAYNLMLRGEIPTVRIGKCRRVRPENLAKYIDSNIYTLNQYIK
jgi:excisionase family DNA binding protein